MYISCSIAYKKMLMEMLTINLKRHFHSFVPFITLQALLADNKQNYAYKYAINAHTTMSFFP